MVQSLLIGAVTGGLGGGLGWAAKQAKAVVSKALGEQTKQIAVLADNGLAYYDAGRPDKAIFDALDVPALEGHFDVIGHGTQDGQLIAVKGAFGKTYYTAEQVAASVKSSLSEDTFGAKERIGKDIRLLSCYLGKLDDGFAQELADRTGLNVIAATDQFNMGRWHCCCPQWW